MKKPKVITKCVASHYDMDNERTLEFSHNGKGGLINFRENDKGELVVSLYRLDDGITVAASYDSGTKHILKA